VADLLLQAGDEGLVLLDEGAEARTEVEWVEGIRVDCGYLSPYFVNHAASRERRLDNAADFADASGKLKDRQHVSAYSKTRTIMGTMRRGTTFVP